MSKWRNGNLVSWDQVTEKSGCMDGYDQTWYWFHWISGTGNGKLRSKHGIGIIGSPVLDMESLK